MTRTEFEALRDLPNKRISQDVRFRRPQQTRPNVIADDVTIENSAGVELRLTVHYNPERGSKTFNVHVLGKGPICRLDVDGPPHRPAGESHKHSVQTDDDINLREGVIDRPTFRASRCRSCSLSSATWRRLSSRARWKASKRRPVIGVSDITTQVHGQAFVHDVSVLKRGHIRVETAFRYPDGGSIEVFVRKPDLTGEVHLTDLGQTQAWLLDMQLRPWLSKKRQAFLQDALETYGVTQNGGELTLQVENLGKLMEGIIRLGQACLRVADLTFTRRASLQTSFVEQVEEVVDDFGLEYEPDAKIEGKYGALVQVDLLVTGAHAPSLVLAWSSGNTGQAHVTQNEIFRKWSDLDKRSEQRLTIYDDNYDVYRDEDMRRLADVSMLVAVSDRHAMQLALGA